jgi:hypothetical protein
MKTKDVLKEITDEIFNRINEQYVDIFLCGGASSKKEQSIRDCVRDELKKVKNIRVLYPEDLFIEMLYKNREFDLLSLEAFLADNCDIICIICEGPGALVELGAFTNSKETITKVIAVIDEKYKRDKSFIMLGPIRLLSSKDKKKVVYYNTSEVEKLAKELNSNANLLLKENNKNSKICNGFKVDSILGLYRMIPLLLFFFSETSSTLLVKYLKEAIQIQGKNIEDKKFDLIFQSALKLLYKEKVIVKQKDQKNAKYRLTKSGYVEVYRVLGSIKFSHKTKMFDKIRFDVINSEFY